MKEYDRRPYDLGSDNRVRQPIKGLRTRLRTYIRSIGITNKFRTDIHRNGTIYIITNQIFELPIMEFETHPLKFLIKN
jgi:hypothetical protein